MPENMTPEEVEQELRRLEFSSTGRAEVLRAHIAAVESERDGERDERVKCVEGRRVAESERETVERERADLRERVASAEEKAARHEQSASDAWRQLRDAKASLRERVQALEKELTNLRAIYEEGRGERDSMRTRLAAIRQRAASREDLGVIVGEWLHRREETGGPGTSWADCGVAVGRFIVGEDATGVVDPLHPNGRCMCAGEGTCAWCIQSQESERNTETHDHCYRADGSCECGAFVQEEPTEPTPPKTVAAARNAAGLPPLLADHEVDDEAAREVVRDAEQSEPSTVEAFATLRDFIHDADGHWPASKALALLERRMGAMGRELGVIEREMYREHFATAERMVKDLRAALTDAPSVFTLEEVEALRAAGGRMANACYNLKQQAGPGSVLDAITRESLAEAQREWDEASRALRT